MRTAWFLPLALCGSLIAQDAFARFGLKAEGDKTWEAFIGGLARRGIPVFVLIGTEEKTLAAKWEKLLRDEELAELNLEPQKLLAKDPLSAELRKRFGWSLEPRWAGISKTGNLLATGTGVPNSGTALAGQLLGSGFESPVQVLEAFLARHPGHGEAHEALVKARFDLAMRRFRDWQVRAKNPAGPLADDEDARIFRSFAYSLDRLMTLPEWPSSIPRQLTFPANKPIPKSGILGALSLRHLASVEAQLRRTPRSRGLWNFWLFLADSAGGRPLLPLLDSIDPRPDGLGSPFNVNLKRLGEELRSAKSWQRILEIFSPIVDRLLNQPTIWFTSTQEGFSPAWETQISPLLEAQLRMGSLTQAEETLHRFLEWSKWAELPGQAAALARKCGQVQLGQAWGSLPVPQEKK